MDKTQINKFENDSTIIGKYVKSAAFGKNKLMYFPLVIGIGLLFFLIFIVFDGLTQTVGVSTLGILAAITILCFMSVILINRSVLKKLKEETKFAPLCIAKKIYGNDDQNIYYCIYTSEEKRHDETFINDIANKIFAIPSDTKDSTEKQILSLFKIDLAKPGEFAKKLPLSFTNGVTVWRKQFALGPLPKNIQQQIEDNNGQFWVVAINPENAKLFIEMYL